MATPHDDLFCEVFADPPQAEALLRSTLPPPLVAAIDWRSLTVCQGTFRDEAMREHEADLLLSATVGGRQVLLYLLLEHKSTSDHFTALQLLTYVVRILQRHRRDHPEAKSLPPIVPIVVHHGDRPFSAPVELGSLFMLDDLAPSVAAVLAPVQPGLRFFLDDLALASEAAIEDSVVGTMARLTLLFMQHVRNKPTMQALAAIERWGAAVKAVLGAPGGQAMLWRLWWYALQVTEVVPRDLATVVARIAGKDAEDSVMSTAERLIAQGLQQGLQRGRAEGKAEGKAEGQAEGRALVVLRLLAARFGPVSDETASRVRLGMPEDLDRWAVRILDARALADVFDAR